MIHDNNPKVRINTARALGKIADKKALSPLIMMIHDSDILVQLEAIKAMENFDDDSMIDPLIEALKLSWYSVRYCAAQVLRKITKQNIDVDYEKWRGWRLKEKKY
jgi:HEAT repeat protein